MITTWMVYASLLGAVLGLGALAAERASRALRLSWFPTRALWAASLWASFLLPLVLAVRAPAPGASSASSGPVTLIARGATLALSSTTAASAASATNVIRSTGLSFTMPALRTLSAPTFDRALVIAWMLGTLASLAYLVHSASALARRRRRWSRQVVRGTSVFVAEDFGPALVGVVHPEIVLPAWALSADDASLDLMLRHEVEHRRARDTLLAGACGVAAALCPWNASLWWQFVRLRLAAEIDCDARVLAGSGDARAYATVLVNASERIMATSMLARGFAGRRSVLERRIVAMAATRAPRGVSRALAAAAIAVLCVALACAAPKPQGMMAGARAPSAFTQTTVAQQRYYPRLARIDTVDAAGTAWLRAAIARYYPRVVTGDTSIAFVSLYVSADGRIVGASARSSADLGADTTDAAFPFDLGAYSYGTNAPAGERSRVAAEQATFKADEDTMFRSQVPTASVLGARTVLPRELTYDSLAGTSPYDPFLGADPHAFQRVDDIYLKPGMVGPIGVQVHVLTLLPGRGGSGDFGHHVIVRRVSLAPPSRPAPQADIEHLGDLPGGGWAVTDPLWRTLEHKPVILVDGVVRSFEDMIALAGRDTVVDTKRLPATAAMLLTRDPAAANGAIVVTTKGHRPAK